jgi:hypothetical protein
MVVQGKGRIKVVNSMNRARRELHEEFQGLIRCARGDRGNFNSYNLLYRCQGVQEA